MFTPLVRGRRPAPEATYNPAALLCSRLAARSCGAPAGCVTSAHVTPRDARETAQENPHARSGCGGTRGGEGSGGSRSAPLDPASRARAVEDPRAQTGPRRIRSRAEKWSVEDPASRCSDGRTWSARGWLAVRAGFGCDSLRFSIERPSVFHWIFTTVSCREARRQQLWRSSAGGQHSTPTSRRSDRFAAA